MTRHSDRARFCTTYLVLALAAGCTVDDEEGVAVFDDDDRDVQLDEIDSLTELGEDGEVVRVSSVTSDLALAVPAYATITAGGRTIELPLGLSTTGIDLPAGDPLDPALIELGNLLFFDRRLSSTGAMSCATCHVPARGYAAIAFNVGVGGNRLARTTPPATNRLYGTENNWLGQTTLEQQSTKPIVSALEMGLTSSTLLAAVRAVPGYVERFDRLAAAGQLAAPAVSVANIGKAIATFQRTLFAGASRVDRYEAGDLGALTTPEIAGRTLFHGRARCALCHNGPNYSNEQFHNIVSGCPNSTDTCVHPTTTFEAGRYLVSGNQADIGRFKTPSLRNVGLRGPYFHNGIDATLDKVVHGYNVGADLDTQIGQDPLLINLGLNTAEKAQLVAFMKALTGTVVVSATLSRAGLPSSTPWRERALLSPDVFDVAFYRSRNPDIAGIDTMTDDQVRSHWVRIGAAEGRRANLAFYPREYDRYLTVVDTTYSPASTTGTYLPAVQRYLDRDRRIGRQYSGRYVLWSGFFAYREYRRLNSSRLAFATPAAVVHDFLTFGLANQLDGREQYPAGVAFLVGGVTYRIASANTYCRLTIGSTSKLPIWPYIPPRLRSIGACAG